MAGFEATLTLAWLQRGPLACALWPLGRLYAGVTALRRVAYRRGWLATVTSAVPVIVVGNRVAGGAGKTPTVLAIVDHLRARGRRPGIVSRGHGRKGREPTVVEASSHAGAVGDEPLLLYRRAGVPVVVGADRARAAALLLDAHPELDCLVADDGLQHLRWARDVEVVVFDARGAGNGWPLPAGPLREPIDAAPRGRHLLHLYTDGVRSTRIAGAIARRRIGGVVDLAAWWQGEPASAAALSALQDRAPLACAGIAQPQRFFAMLAAAGLHFEALPLPDHAAFETLPWPASATDVVVTEKDAVKLDAQRLARERPATRVWVAPLDFEPEPAFGALLDAALADLAPRLRNPPAKTRWTAD
ncbi:MAG TPA: tetraacyldisaccharide 4'-kinase [Methylibium sp.]|uniref:tetraacyldisaccharide 4'-kinase n=1 Tax=Methylibium sp. TaxID=2067992 RepID=UPI002DBC333C|nr:tetraacyldisaccharide 4'-kinase [Methylibium sp.]HEU4458402.1 tetraacyldisaccharide 4'-kinase [Methylibium sp.]